MSYGRGIKDSKELLGSDEEKYFSSDDSEISFFCTEDSINGTWITEGARRIKQLSNQPKKSIENQSDGDDGDSNLYLKADTGYPTSHSVNDRPRVPPRARLRDPSDHEGKYGPWFEGPDPFGDIAEDGIPYDGPYESSSDEFEWSEHESGSEIDSFLGGSRRRKIKKPASERLPPKPLTHYRSLLVNGRRRVRRKNSSSSEDNIPVKTEPEKRPSKTWKFWRKLRVRVVDTVSDTVYN